MTVDVEAERALRRVTDEARWVALLALRPDGDPVGEYDVDDERRMIFDLATMPGADDPDPVVELIADLARPEANYDTVGMLCRELLRLRLEVDELRRAISLQAN